jgi:hypothetical protein
MGEYAATKFESSAALEIMQPANNEFGTCLFPLLTDGVLVDDVALPQTTQQLTALDLGSLCIAKTLRDFCAQNGLALPTLFNSVWALVLGRFLDSDSIGFVAASGAAGESKEGVCHAQLDKTRSVVEFMKEVELTTMKSFDYYAAGSLSPLSLLTSHSDRQVFNSMVEFQGMGAAGDKNIHHQVRYSLYCESVRQGIWTDW